MAEKKSSANYKKYLRPFVTPYFIGFIVTLVFLWGTREYQFLKDDSRPNSYIEFLKRLHNFSIDLRFRARGERQVSEDIALITIDEKSLEQEGRWPWPRVKIKRIIENLLASGARSIGFDIIFAEEDLNATVLSLQELKKHPDTPPQMIAIFDQALAKANTDNDLAETVTKLGDRLVMGVYGEDTFLNNGYRNMCTDMFYKESPEYAPWSHTIQPIVVADVSVIFENEIPGPWVDILKKHRQTLEQKATAEFLKKNGISEEKELSKTQKVYLDREIRAEFSAYCWRWLDKENDEIYSDFEKAWPEIQPDLEGTPTFEAALTQLKENYLDNPIRSVERWWHNYPAISAVAKHIAYFNAIQDSDGTIRSTPLVYRSGNNYYPSLALKTFLVAQGKTTDSNFQIKFEPDEIFQSFKKISDFQVVDEEAVKIGSIPVSTKGEMLINFAGPQKMYPHVSVADILSSDDKLTYVKRVKNPKSGYWEEMSFVANKSEFLKNKILLIGATATGIYDLRVTPFEKNYPGLETHANILDNVLQSDYYVEASKLEEGQMLIAMLILGILFTFVVGYFGAAVGMGTSAMGITGIYFYDKTYLFEKGIVSPVIFPLFLVLGIFLILTSFKYFTEERNKKKLKSTFAKYVSPAIVNEVLSDPSKIELGGRKERMTVFFSDVRGFTTISEKLDPRALGDLLNSYLTPMTEIVFKNKGTLDKYMGDAIMAFFGAPISYPDHATWAARCALEQLVKLKQLQEEYRKNGLPEIDIGIGLNTGDMSVGNMGSETVRSYTVMGDSVNLGSRLEGITKQYGTKIIVSEFTHAEIKDKFVMRELDWVRVKGKLKPVKIYELMGEGALPPEVMETVKWFNEGYTHYHTMKWQQAVDCFNKSLSINPEDGPSKVYLERCLNYLESPPPADWDGVFIMKTK